MGVVVCFLQLFKGCVGIYLRGGKALVSEQVLHPFEIGLMVEHGGGEGVAQHVGRPFLERRHLREVFAHEVLHLVAVHTQSVVVDEERMPHMWLLRIAACHVMVQSAFQFIGEGYEPFLVALAQHLELSVGEIHRLVIESDEFGETYTRGIE